MGSNEKEGCVLVMKKGVEAYDFIALELGFLLGGWSSILPVRFPSERVVYKRESWSPEDRTTERDFGSSETLSNNRGF